MADIYLSPDGIDSAIQQLAQAGRAATDSMDTTLTELRTFAESFRGATATAWSEFQAVVNREEGGLREDLTQGTRALQQMKEILQSGDRRGAGRFQ